MKIGIKAGEEVELSYKSYSGYMEDTLLITVEAMGGNKTKESIISINRYPILRVCDKVFELILTAPAGRKIFKNTLMKVLLHEEDSPTEAE